MGLTKYLSATVLRAAYRGGNVDLRSCVPCVLGSYDEVQELIKENGDDEDIDLDELAANVFLNTQYDDFGILTREMWESENLLRNYDVPESAIGTFMYWDNDEYPVDRKCLKEWARSSDGCEGTRLLYEYIVLAFDAALAKYREFGEEVPFELP